MKVELVVCKMHNSFLFVQIPKIKGRKSSLTFEELTNMSRGSAKILQNQSYACHHLSESRRIQNICDDEVHLNHNGSRSPID